MDAKDVPNVKLNNGLTIPIIGLGTHEFSPTGSLYSAIRDAIDNGYRNFDFAYVYKSEEEVGKAINDAIIERKVNREDLYLVSKLWITFFKKDRVEVGVKRILANLNTPYLDLCVIHWNENEKQDGDEVMPKAPNKSLVSGDVDYLEAWRGLEKCVSNGLVRSIGVSNFNALQIDSLLKFSSIKPVTNQVECHPYLAQNELKKFCEENEIILTAYSPLGNPGKPHKEQLLKDYFISRLSQKYGKTSGQILFKFQAQRGVIVIPKTIHLNEILSNIQIFDFNLTDEEIKELESLDPSPQNSTYDAFGIPKLPVYPLSKHSI